MPLSRRRFLLSSVAMTSLGACGGSSGADPGGPLRLGHFPNITHAAAILGVESGAFAEALAPTPLEVMTFNAGPAAIEALLSGGLDVAYIGPNPTINGFVRSKGAALRVIAGATSGGAALVVKGSIGGPGDLRGEALATPQLGGTQDVALRSWLLGHGLKTDVYGGGDVSVQPQENAQTLEAFRAGTIAGAWVPEPWASRLVIEGGGKVLVDERSLWPEGRFVTTHVVARTEVLRARPAAIEALLRAHVRQTRWARANPDAAREQVVAGIKRVTGKAIPEAVARAAWQNLELTTDPLAESLRASAAAAAKVGLLTLDGVDLGGLWELDALARAEAAEGVA